ncbi:hypothetical protein H9X86_05730 [Pseudoflavonifractor capillosus]|uniref:hypothetical protein n=1 Tax=Pseudoflavonifractor capillosus TaxID=106588 RepID=UPI00195CA93D|nr:hypothetical protein [Pseudoflavonifractor capillosus]MBM6896867.1 hypothetical protein [Pseudoflavonifractor capillosus]
MAYTYNDFLKKATDNGTLSSFTAQELSLAKAFPEYGISAASLKQEQNTAATSAQRAIANQAAAQLRASYNGFTGSKQDEIDNVLGQIGSFPDFSWDQEAPTYENKYEEEQDAILDQLDKYPDFSWDQEAPTYENPYEQIQQDLLDKILNREDFTWDKDTDPVFGAYQKQYLREGERATANALAQAAAASGGQTSSYAATAAAQAGNYYAAQLSDKIPELYNQAYQRYLSEYEQLANDLGLVNNQQQIGYKEYLDKLSQYNTDKNFAYQQYLDDYNKLLSYLDAVNGQEQMDYQEYKDKLGQFNVDKEFAYQQYLDDYNKLQSYLGNLQSENQSEYEQYLDEQQRMDSQNQQNKEMAQTQVDGILKAGVMPSSDLIAKSGYSQEYVNAMLQYYRQQAALAARKSSGGSGSSGTGSSGSSSGGKQTSSGTKPAMSSSTGRLVSVPKYGEIPVTDAERLVSAGLLRRTGVDKYGQPTYIPTAKKPTENILVTR